MSNKTAIASRTFMRSDTKEHVKLGKPIEGPAEYIDELERLGMVRITKTKTALETPEAKAAKPATKAATKKAD